MNDGTVSASPGDALIVVDVQRDFLPRGSLAVPEGDMVVPILNRYLGLFRSRNLPIYFTRDWHPADHSSFKEQGGIWPPHCVAGTEGAEFAPGLEIDQGDQVISKAESRDRDAYSGFEGTNLKERLRDQGVHRVFVGGLATDYCILNTVRDALKEDFTAVLLTDAVRAVNVKPGDGDRAAQEMADLGALRADYGAVSA